MWVLEVGGRTTQNTNMFEMQEIEPKIMWQGIPASKLILVGLKLVVWLNINISM